MTCKIARRGNEVGYSVAVSDLPARTKASGDDDQGQATSFLDSVRLPAHLRAAHWRGATSHLRRVRGGRPRDRQVA